jgi:hypothetical protein
MKCEKCNSKDIAVVTETTGKVKGRGLFATLGHLGMACATGGAWLVVPLVKSGVKGKTESKDKCICKDCNHKWYI